MAVKVTEREVVKIVRDVEIEGETFDLAELYHVLYDAEDTSWAGPQIVINNSRMRDMLVERKVLTRSSGGACYRFPKDAFEKIFKEIAALYEQPCSATHPP